jgi:hypothetical protein
MQRLISNNFSWQRGACKEANTSSATAVIADNSGKTEDLAASVVGED